MDQKQSKPKNKILKYLPKSASAVSVSFQNHQFSPGRDHKRSDIYSGKHKGSFAGKGFSGPIISIIPKEARRKTSKNEETFGTQEPTSPKVSCMGQIKHKKQIIKAKCASSHPKVSSSKPVVVSDKKSSSSSSSSGEVKKPASKLRRIFSMAKPGRKSDNNITSSNKTSTEFTDRAAPSLGQMKRFTSGRCDAFSSFDWISQIAPVEAADQQRDYHSDEDRIDNDFEDEDDEEEEVIIPFSAPMTVGGGLPLQPRKEINLWKRRTLNPPRPLQLKPMVSAN